MKKGCFLFLFLVLCINLHGQNQKLKQYNERRSKLINEVKSHNFIHGVSLSKGEEQVNDHLKFLLGKELKREAAVSQKSFVEMKKHIENSPLFDFLQQMPKGAILHAHPQALGDFNWLVKEVTYRSDCYM